LLGFFLFEGLIASHQTNYLFPWFGVTANHCFIRMQKLSVQLIACQVAELGAYANHNNKPLNWINRKNYLLANTPIKVITRKYHFITTGLYTQKTKKVCIKNLKLCIVLAVQFDGIKMYCDARKCI